MRISLKLLLIPLLSIILIPASADESKDECIFTASLEKTWIFYSESPWVRGSVVDCDNRYIQDKDRVYVKLLDINGDRIDGKWKGIDANTKSLNPSQYEYGISVYRGGAMGFFDSTKVPAITLNENEYFFYMPSISSLDFDHRGIYQIQLTYGDHTRVIWFATLSPDVRWDQELEK